MLALFMGRRFSSLFAVLTVLMLAQTLCGQGKQNRFVIRLNSDNLNSLQSVGSLRSLIPEKVRGKISAIVICTDENQTLAAKEFKDSVDYALDAVVIDIDDRLLREIQKQPLAFSVADSLFAQVFMNYKSTDRDPVNPRPREISIAKTQFFVKLANGKTLAGKVYQEADLKINCTFGEALLPLEFVSGIRFRSDDKGTAVVIMTNGDIVSGEPLFDSLKLKTDWGLAEVETGKMETMTNLSDRVIVRENTDMGPRWKLVAKKPSDSQSR